MIYQALGPSEPLSQGDVLDGCPLIRFQDPDGPFDPNGKPSRWDARVLVLTQACDLAQAKSRKVMVALIVPADELVAQGLLKAATVRDQVRRGLIHGWYFLPKAPAPVDLPESIVDLREVHTIPRALAEHLIATGKRVARVVTPYREHLAQHFAVTYMRIGLPEPYETAV